eukprot:1206486-Pyramimonas_sp.AAC.1
MGRDRWVASYLRAAAARAAASLSRTRPRRDCIPAVCTSRSSCKVRWPVSGGGGGLIACCMCPTPRLDVCEARAL